VIVVITSTQSKHFCIHLRTKVPSKYLSRPTSAVLSTSVYTTVAYLHRPAGLFCFWACHVVLVQ